YREDPPVPGRRLPDTDADPVSDERPFQGADSRQRHAAPAALFGLPHRPAVARPADLISRKDTNGGDADGDGRHAALGSSVAIHRPVVGTAAASAGDLVSASSDAF